MLYSEQIYSFFTDQVKGENMEHQEKPILAVVAGLIHRGTQLLLCQRPAHKARPLKWEFPGGKIEPGETPQEALIRECREELRIEIRPLESVTQLQWQYDDVTVSLSLWEAVIVEGEPQLLEHQAMQWLPLEELDNLPLCPADEKMLPDIRKWWSRRFSDTVLYDKLVRDEIPRMIQQNGNQCIYDVLSPAEYLRRLDEKLQEEVTEYRESGELEELADIGEVLLAILEYRGISRQAYEQAILQKRRERGGFSKRLLLREVRTPPKA